MWTNNLPDYKQNNHKKHIPYSKVAEGPYFILESNFKT